MRVAPPADPRYPDNVRTSAEARVYEVVFRGEAPRARVVVCVPTLRRPALLERTLRSLASQDFAQPFVCVVADNDPVGREGAALAAATMRGGGVSGAAIIVPRPGNCAACNAAFSAARALYPDVPLVAMIDDDEEAAPEWLRLLVEAQARTGAALVGGPVFPRFEHTDPGRFAAHPVFRPYYVASGPVPFLYGSGNVLMRAAVLDRMGEPAFDDAFNFVGGGDLDFFKRCRDAGLNAHFEAGATATETVPLARTSVRWVMARGLRYGAINYMIESKQAGSRLARLRIPIKSLALMGLSPVRALRQFAASGDPLIACHPVMEAVGRLAAQFNLRPEQYRTTRRAP